MAQSHVTTSLEVGLCIRIPHISSSSICLDIQRNIKYQDSYIAFIISNICLNYRYSYFATTLIMDVQKVKFIFRNFLNVMSRRSRVQFLELQSKCSTKHNEITVTSIRNFTVQKLY